MTTLYARSQNGKIKVWKISGDTVSNTVIIETGYIDGTLIYTTRPCTFTSMEKEINSRIKSKKREGYKSAEELSITLTEPTQLQYLLNCQLPSTNLDLNFNLKPNKAVKFRDRKPKYPCIGQPKLNGLRGVIRMESVIRGTGLFRNSDKAHTIKTMGGLEYLLPHITNNINSLNYNNVELALDGELYIPGFKLNDIKKAVPMVLDNGTISKVSRPDLTERVKFYCFDLAIEDVSQLTRLTMRNNFLSSKIQNIVIVRHRIINSDEEAIAFANECVAHGYEGAVFRQIDSEYKFGSRTVDLVKLKFFNDGEFEIIDVIPKPKRPDLGMFVCKNDINDETFTVNPMGSEAEHRDYLANKENYVGKMVTVKYYERSGVKNVPWHGNALAFRNEGD